MLRRLRLSTLLIALNLGILLVVVTFVASTAVGLLESLSDEEGLSRVAFAGDGALRSVVSAGADLASTARLLGERPTLLRLLRGRDDAALEAFLDPFRRSARLDGCAVFASGRLVARAGPALPWEAIRSARPPGGGGYLAGPAAGAGLALAAGSAVPGLEGAEAFVIRLLDDRFAREISDRIGPEVRFVETAEAEARVDDPRAPVRERALSSEERAAARPPGAGAFVAALPLRAPDGRIVGLVEAEISTAPADASVRRLVETLVALSFVVAGLAALLGYLLARRLGRPVGELTEAAERIGRGDLSTPVPRAPGFEVGTLSGAMEEMRAKLLHLTAELRRREAEAVAVVTGIIEGVFTVDRERRIRYLNPQAARLLGIDPSAAAGKFCGDVLRPQGPDGVRPCEEQCPIVHARFRGGARATEHLAPAGGLRRTVVITSAPPADGGEAQQFQLLRDETEQEATRRLRDTVLANISHEFRTPLSAQLASIELLRESLPAAGNEEARELVRSLERGTLRLTQLIDNLLESVRIEAGQDSIRRGAVRLDEVVEEAVEMMAPLVAQKGQRLEVALPYPLPGIAGDGPRLTQVFVNLLANASKFAPPGTAIGIGGEVEPGGEAVVLWVQDEGPGLPPEAGASIFDRFYRTPGEEPEQSGMGLGLWIVKSIVERHGGTVEAHGAGAGTRFRIRLPASGAAAPAGRRSEGSARG